MSETGYPGLDGTKAARRVEFIDGLVDIMTAHKIYKGLTILNCVKIDS